MNDDKILQMSQDVDDFVYKMVSVHGVSFAMVVASIFARLSLITMETKQEVGMMRLITSMQETLLKSLDDFVQEE
jgi:hypothetical protein